MTSITKFLAAAAAIGALAVPAAAQYYPQPAYPQYPQQYPQYPQQYPYPQQGYGYNQGYTGNPVTDVIDQLLGNRYNVTDRQAVRQCANAARAQAQSQYGYGGYNQGYGAYNQGYGYNQGNRGQGYGGLRISAITSVERRSNGLRISGVLSQRGGYSEQYGYANQGYAQGDLSFRCNVDYRGAVTGLRVRPYGYRG